MIGKPFLYCALLCPAFSLAPAAFGSTLAHDYNLTSSLNDLVGSNNLSADGGTITSSGYSFGANQGLNVSSALVSGSDYSILVDFDFGSLSGYRKIIDFANRTSDDGLYNLNDMLDFYPVADGSPVLAPNTPARIVLTRDSATGVVTGYVDTVRQFSFTDTSTIAVFSGPSQIMRFFEDDTVTGENEASSGVATRISVYDGALTSAEVAALGGPSLPSAVPEPASFLLSGIGLAALMISARRKSSV